MPGIQSVCFFPLSPFRPVVNHLSCSEILCRMKSIAAQSCLNSYILMRSVGEATLQA